MQEEQIWFDNLKILFDKRYITNFFPSQDKTYTTNINAITRFIIINCIILTIYNNDTNYMLFCILLLSFMFMFLNKRKTHIESNNIDNQTTTNEECRLPTKDNPMANNILTTDDSLSACDVTNPKIKKEMHATYNDTLFKDVTDIYETKNSERQFYTMPNTRSFNDQTGFAEWLYGKKNRKMCKSDVEVCSGFENAFGANGGRNPQSI